MMASTKRRIGRGAGIALVLALSLSTLSACSSGRSVEAYCDVLSTHKDRYLSAMNEVNTTDDFLASLTGAVGAFGEISQMWDEAAKVAPSHIQSAVEAVRDFWDGQLETAKEMINDPLGGLASAFMEAASNSGAVERVDAYTATNCPSVGAMFFTGTGG